MGLAYFRTAERPDIQMWLQDEDGALVDFSSGYTFSFKLGHPTQAAVFTKTTGITGAAGSGVQPTGTPNVTLTFTAGELSAVATGTYTWQLTATTGGLDRVWDGKFTLKAVIA
jgi:hypothetical protein